jgi:hypothetical protein
MRMLRLTPILLFLVGLALVPDAVAATSVKVIASDLDNPRHLAFGSRGDLYVAEAGGGGSGPCFIGGEGPACMGASGAITRLDRKGRQSRVLDGLASYANDPGNANAIGPHGIFVRGAHDVLFTNGGPTAPGGDNGPISRDTLADESPVAALFGRLMRLKPNGKVKRIADIWDFERDNNPDGEVGNPAIDSNPVDVLWRRGRFFVADAGGNAIDKVKPNGRVTNLAVFPNRAGVPNPDPSGPPIDMQAVPTSVVMGRDHRLYVSQLTGFPFPFGGANIYRVHPRTGAMSVFADGFTMIMDLAFAKDGTLYVLEIDHDNLLGGSDDGAIFAIAPSGAKRQIELPAGTLTHPGGITVRKGAIYVSNHGAGVPGEGEVLEIREG